MNYDDPKVQEFDMLYSDSYTYNDGFFYDWNDFFANWKENHKGINDERPKYVYGTSLTSIGFDINWLIDNACEELHEEAQEQISNQDREELQQLLDKWSEKQTGTKTYYEDERYMVRIPWELYNEGQL